MTDVEKSEPTRSARRLDLQAIVSTSERLSLRISDRFPNRGLCRISEELVAVGIETRHQLEELSKPNRIAQAVAVLLTTVAITSVVLVVIVFEPEVGADGVSEWLNLLENGIQDLVFLAIAGFFVVGVEGRLKRRRALAGLHTLRSLAHVIDMHQLAKDPESAVFPTHRTEHSPKRSDEPEALLHYLDYCSEMLSIINKLAALYVQESQDSVVLSSVTGIQDLTTSLSGKLWQKITIINEMRAANGAG